jgi:pimeloyl-ACP methyl ester carboxylesterase
VGVQGVGHRRRQVEWTDLLAKDAAASLRALYSEPIEERDDVGNLIGSFGAHDLEFGLGYGRSVAPGLSLGGMIGQWLGANAPDRLTHLVLANTSPKMADPALFEQRRRTVLQDGMAAIADAVMQRFFSARTLARALPEVASVQNTLLATAPAGYAGCCAARVPVKATAMATRSATAAAGVGCAPVIW